MSAEENKAIARRLYEAASAGGEYDEIADEVLAPDYVGHMPPYPDMHGPDGDKEFNARTLTILPDARIEIEDMVAEGDRVAVRWTLSGTHEGTTRMGVAPPPARRWRRASAMSSRSPTARSWRGGATWTFWASCSRWAPCPLPSKARLRSRRK